MRGSNGSDRVDFFAFAGQSNALGHFWRRDGDTSLREGSQVFEDRIKELTGHDSQAFNTAVGGAGSNQYSNPDNYWWDLAKNKPGPLLIKAVADIKANLAKGQDLDGVVWCQGETDAYSIFFGGDSKIFTDYFVEATTKTFAYFRKQFGADLPILIQELGDFPVPDGALPSQPNAFDILRNAQENIIANDPHTHLAADTTGLPYYADEIHYPTSSYEIIAEDLADKAVDVIFGSGNPAVNVAPIIDMANTQAQATIYEIDAGATGAGYADVKATGAIAFTDANAGDVHSASVVAKGAGYYGEFKVLSIKDGKVNWQFLINDSVLDVLDEGESGSQSYDVVISDGKGGIVTQTVTITAFGKGETIIEAPVNAAPIIDVANTNDGATIYEIDAGAVGEKTADVKATGAIVFTDSNGGDVHSATVTPNGAGYYGDFKVTSVANGKVNWQFTINDSILDVLDEGESGSQSYNVVIDDGNGGTATQTVTITAFGKGETIISNPIPTNPVNIINGTDSADFLSGTSGDDLINLGSGNDVVKGSAGNDVINGGGSEYDQVDYAGSADDYLFTANVDGSINVAKANGTDTLTAIDGIWFEGEGVWCAIDQLVMDDAALA